MQEQNFPGDFQTPEFQIQHHALFTYPMAILHHIPCSSAHMRAGDFKSKIIVHLDAIALRKEEHNFPMSSWPE